jgi:hypothetical protein
MVQGEVKKGARWAPICQTRDASYFNGQVMAEISKGGVVTLARGFSALGANN